MRPARAVAVLLIALSGAAWPATRTLQAITFPGGFNWPFWVAQEKGFFAAEGLEVKLTPATGSIMQMGELAEGKFDIAISTIDNVIAYDEGQGEARLAAAPDFFAFMGAQYGAVRLVANPSNRSIADLKGKSLAVDASTTGYAFVLRKLLENGGLAASEYTLESVGATGLRAEALMQNRTDATILTSPLEIVPESRGYRRLANAVDVVGPYQALTGVARRSWAKENRESLVGFIKAYVKALEWLGDPSHRADAIAIYRAHLPQASEAIAGKAWDVLLAGPEGFQKKAKLDRAGIETVISLRKEFARPSIALGNADKYIDESYYNAATFAPGQASTAPVITGPEKNNMELVGSDPLQGRSAYQPTVHKQGDRWILYVGHHGGKTVNSLTGKAEDNGTSILDVTDPKRPQYLAHIPGEPGQGESGGAQMVRVCDGATLPHADKSRTYMLRVFGNAAHEIWDVTNPAKPSLLTNVVNKLKGTHKNWWECDTGIAYLVSGVEGWRTRRMTLVYDLSDPTKPRFIREFGLAGQQPGSKVEPAPTELHGPISTGPSGNRVYFGYGTNKGGIVQIVDREKLLKGPKEPTDANLNAPEVGRLYLPPTNGAHTVFPMLGMDVAEFAKDAGGPKRDFALIVDESLVNECQEPRQMVWIADITAESRPFNVSSYTAPEESGHFCSRGGRFGSHSSNESMAPVFYKRVVFIAFFNAGVRALDVRDPYHPKEIGYYIPAVTDATDKRCVGSGASERCKVAIQTNNVEVDERGLVYIVDRANTGLHILELTGDARKAANFAARP